MLPLQKQPYEPDWTPPDSWWFRNCADGCAEPAGPPEPPDPEMPLKSVRGESDGMERWGMAVPLRHTGTGTDRGPAPMLNNNGFRCAVDARE